MTGFQQQFFPSAYGMERGYDERALARRTDPETSHAAAASVVEMTTKQAAVLRVLRRLGAWGATDTALVDEYHKSRSIDPGLYPKQSESGIRTRRKELVSQGLVRDTGKRVRLPSRRMSIVWQACASQAGIYASREAA